MILITKILFSEKEAEHLCISGLEMSAAVLYVSGFPEMMTSYFQPKYSTVRQDILK